MTCIYCGHEIAPRQLWCISCNGPICLPCYYKRRVVAMLERVNKDMRSAAKEEAECTRMTLRERLDESRSVRVAANAARDALLAEKDIKEGKH